MLWKEEKKERRGEGKGQLNKLDRGGRNENGNKELQKLLLYKRKHISNH